VHPLFSPEAKLNVIVRAIAVVALFCGCLRAAAVDIDGDPAKVRAIDSIFEQWNNPNTPGCALGIERKGEPLLTRAYGSADLEHDVPVTPSIIFEAGSVSKQLTAAAVLLLAEQGKLALTDDVRKYIPELPDYGTTITINELLGHTSGLRDWGEVEALAGWPRGSRIYTSGDALDVIARQKSLNFRPGTAYSYTNTGYNLLATIVLRASKMSLADFTRKNFFELLGMNNRFLIQGADGDRLQYRRVRAWQPQPSELNALVGRYSSNEALATYGVSVTDGGLILRPQDRRGQTLMLKPLFAGTFGWGDNDDGIVRFIRNGRSRPSGFQMSNSRVRALLFRRAAPTESSDE
jgi:CubicO group peptidase (beta-lactamase class C family)